jgi:hypothetical protein
MNVSATSYDQVKPKLRSQHAERCVTAVGGVPCLLKGAALFRRAFSATISAAISGRARFTLCSPFARILRGVLFMCFATRDLRHAS